MRSSHSATVLAALFGTLACSSIRPVTSPAEVGSEGNSFLQLRAQFAPLELPRSDRKVTFVEASRGLPGDGSWRNSLSVADFNGDGRPDILTPPERGGVSNSPSIFLQQPDGSWLHWQNTTWPRALNYGSVVAGDVNRDGHQDVLAGSHLQGVAVFLGDGRGHFSDASNGLEESFPTRRVVARDLDADGWLDLVALSEGPGAPLAGERNVSTGKLRVYRNENRGVSWKKIDVSETQSVSGDWLATGDFNGDSLSDIATSNIYFNHPDVLFTGSGAFRWRAGGADVLPRYSYYFAVTTGRFERGSAGDDVLLTYGRSWPSSVVPEDVVAPAAASVVGIDRVTWTAEGPRLVPILRTPSTRPIWGIASADFDRDSDLDIVYSNFEPRELVFLLNEGNGSFRVAEVEGITLPLNTSYDITVADVDRDGSQDIVMMFERNEQLREEGSIRVYLNRTVRSEEQKPF
jgi:hypothetical protein